MTINIIRHPSVLQIEMARPDKKNALTGAMYDAMIAALSEAEADANFGAVVISGAGGVFTAGNDIADFLTARGTIEENPASRFIMALAQFQKPLVAAVEGLAVGIGTTLLLHCDLVYAAPSAMFKMPFTDLGLVPEAGSSILLPARVGHVKAAQWLMLGDAFSSQEAEKAGLLNAILPAGQVLVHALNTATRLAAKPRNAMLQTRTLMRGNQPELLAHMKHELAIFGRALQSDEARTAFMAFMSKKG